MTEKLFYKVFNHNEKITNQNIEVLKIELWNLVTLLKKNNDVDNLKILDNKIELILKNNNKLEKKYKKDLFEISDNIDDLIRNIKKISKEDNKKLIDVVKEVSKKYKKCKNLSEEKLKEYTKTCKKTSTIEYEKELAKLQLEMVKLQKHITESWKKLLIIFEWRDAAWKWGTIKRFMEHLNPRTAKVIALNKPTELERSQWYFQRYIQNLPSWWEIILFDRSWYNRWWVEPVMWFCSKEEYNQFMIDTPKFEKMLVDSWIKLIKFYFSVSKIEQAKRFESRKTNPLKQYKLSPIDQFSQQLWEKYTLAEYNNIKNTHTEYAPWILIKSDNKKIARLNAIKYVLNQFQYPGKINIKDLELNKNIVCSGQEKIKNLSMEIDIKENLFD